MSQTDDNLLAAAGKDKNVKIYDRRESKIVKVFGDGLHSGKNSENVVFVLNIIL